MLRIGLGVTRHPRMGAVEEPSGTRYSYVGNRPQNFVDPQVSMRLIRLATVRRQKKPVMTRVGLDLDGIGEAQAVIVEIPRHRNLHSPIPPKKPLSPIGTTRGMSTSAFSTA